MLVPTLTVAGTDVTSGPSFVTTQAYGPNDTVAVSATGTVDLAGGNFQTSAAGIIKGPATTLTGHHPGQYYLDAIRNRPYGSVLIGNPTIGFEPLFNISYENGYASSTPTTNVTASRPFSQIFGANMSTIPAGTTLFLLINDTNSADNSGFFVVASDVVTSVVPEPATLSMMAIAPAMLLRRRR